MTVRAPLTRERVLRSAMSFADEHGIASLSMRRLGRTLGFEAMSLYNHVANKDDVLDGMIELVVEQFLLPSEERDWKECLRETARSIREVLRRHPWAAALIESRVTPSPARFRYSEALIGTLRRAGFSLESAFRAQLTISSYVHGFAFQEVTWPFEAGELSEVATTLQPRVDAHRHPHLAEMMDWIIESRSNGGGLNPEFEFGLELILDGLEALRGE